METHCRCSTIVVVLCALCAQIDAECGITADESQIQIWVKEGYDELVEQLRLASDEGGVEIGYPLWDDLSAEIGLRRVLAFPDNTERGRRLFVLDFFGESDLNEIVRRYCELPFIGEMATDRLVLVREGTPDTLAVVRRTNDEEDGDLPETTFGDLQRIEVYLGDDSVIDVQDGAALFGFEVFIYDDSGNEMRFWSLANVFLPIIQGGFVREGHLAADGWEEIYLLFDFRDESYTGPEPGEIERVVIEMTLANDYYFEVYLNGILEVNARALGNIRDLSNKVVIRIEVVEEGQGRVTFIEPASWAQVKGSF